MKLKKTEIALDAGILLTGLMLITVLLTGGFQVNLGEHIIGLRSFRNPVILFILFFTLRFIFYGKPFSYLRLQPRDAKDMWIILSLLGVIIIIYLSAVNYLSSSANITEKPLDLGLAEAITPESSINHHNGKIRLTYDGEYISEFRIPVGDISDYSKVRVTFSKQQGMKSLTIINLIYEKTDKGIPKGVSVVRKVNGVFVYDFPLIKDEFDAIKIILKSNLGSVNSEISKISLLAPQVSDYPYFTLVLSVIIAFSLLFPGLLIISALTSQNRSDSLLLISLFTASLVFYFLLYLLLELTLVIRAASPGLWLFNGLLLFMMGLVYLNYRVDRFNTLNRYIYSARIPLFIFILVLLLLTAYIDFDTLYPFQNLGWKSISGPKTFDVFNAHDNYFQYANGRVIAENLPFGEEYGYGNRPLVFMPEDREILAGTIYAVYRSVISVLSPYIGNAFMTYTILGVAMNLMVIFPVIAFARRYVDIKSEILLAFLLFGNAVFIVQSSMTWFKFSGAALFLSALLVLLRDRQHLLHWMLAGLMFALGANMHGAVAIGIPLFFLWFVYQRGRESNFKPISWLAGPFFLITVFMLVNMPWKLVKKFYLHDSIQLVTGFFFGGYKVDGSLYQSAMLFFSNTPLSEQISLRIHNITQTFRLDELLMLPSVLAESGMDKFLLQWTQYEVGYTIFLYYPLLLLLSVYLITNKLTAGSTTMGLAGRGFPDKGRNKELKALIILGLVTQVIFITAAFSYHHPPDVSWVQPYGVTILVYLGMLLLLIQIKLMAGLLIVLALLAYARLFIAYQIIPLPG